MNEPPTRSAVFSRSRTGRRAVRISRTTHLIRPTRTYRIPLSRLQLHTLQHNPRALRDNTQPPPQTSKKDNSGRANKRRTLYIRMTTNTRKQDMTLLTGIMLMDRKPFVRI